MMKCAICGDNTLLKWGGPGRILCHNCVGITIVKKQNTEEGKVAKSIDEHVHILSKKKRQLSYFDDYGYERINKIKWEAEIKHFSQNILNSERYSEKLKLKLNDIILERIKCFDKENKNKKNKFSITHKKISNMTGVDYERFCIDYFIRNGWKASPTKMSGDQGADIIAIKNGVTIVCQCKRFKSSVGNKAVQEVFAAKGFYEADAAIVLTNSYYTNSAQNLARQLDVKLLTHEDIDYITIIKKPTKSIVISKRAIVKDKLQNAETEKSLSNTDKFISQCVSIFTANGWELQTSPKLISSKIDVILTKKECKSLAIKFKYPKRTISENAVKDIYNQNEHLEVDLTAIIARSPFSKSAIEQAKKLKVILIHYNDIKQFSVNGSVD